MNVSYIVITPVRNEGPNLQHTIDSIVSQTVRPAQWIVVNDGSEDNTADLINAAAKKHDWITAVHRANRGFRKSGGGVIEAFYDGYAAIRPQTWDFIVKLEGDLSFEPDYFQKCFERFEQNPQLGIAGGTVCNLVDGVLDEDSKGDPRFHVRGATKIYRHECWQQIGGLIRAPGWDTVDEVTANMHGWKTGTFAELKLVHHRATGHADGAWKNWVKNGRANYITGYHPVFMLLKCSKRLFDKPVGVASIGLFYGFVSGYLKRIPRIEDKRVIAYVRRQQMNRLLLQESIWGSPRR